MRGVLQTLHGLEKTVEKIRPWPSDQTLDGDACKTKNAGPCRPASYYNDLGGWNQKFLATSSQFTTFQKAVM
jgi:hypothetical protein